MTNYLFGFHLGCVVGRNVRIFEDKVKNLEVLWDTIHFLASFWASCTTTFKGFSLMWFYLIGCWCVGLKMWASKERLFCVLSI